MEATPGHDHSCQLGRLTSNKQNFLQGGDYVVIRGTRPPVDQMVSREESEPICVYVPNKVKNNHGGTNNSYCLHRLVFIMIYLLVHDDSLTSLRFTTRTEQLTKCCDPLQKVWVRLGTCKIDFSPPVILYY